MHFILFLVWIWSFLWFCVSDLCTKWKTFHFLLTLEPIDNIICKNNLILYDFISSVFRYLTSSEKYGSFSKRLTRLIINQRWDLFLSVFICRIVLQELQTLTTCLVGSLVLAYHFSFSSHYFYSPIDKILHCKVSSLVSTQCWSTESLFIVYLVSLLISYFQLTWINWLQYIGQD